ncbi:MAG: phytanoyl-CoA dioxygenase family protein [Deltaproteobacteria bacterium]|nr:phytanoyl-CoA dioxygenase family protein [Deltaproteobacteria bacterium]
MFVVDPLAVELDAALEHYRANGWARVGRVFDAEHLEALRTRADALMLGQVLVPGLFFQHDSDSGRYEDLRYGEGYVGPSLDYRKLEKLERDALFRAHLENSLFERIARAVLGDAIAIYRATLFNKSARGSSPLPWHQDAGSYWGLDRDPELQIWTALDDCTSDSGCVRVVPGSHHRGLATPLGGLIPSELVEARHAEEHALELPANAGEVLLLHNHLWHASSANQSGRPRRAFTVCYLDAATRCLRRKRAPREFVRVFVRA